jgi:hypothetical protein
VGAVYTAWLLERAAEMIWPESADVDYEVLEAMGYDVTVRSY